MRFRRDFLKPGAILAGMMFCGACTPMSGGRASLKPLRPPAVPLVAVDPFFSVWSAADRLTDRETTHWSGAKQPLSVTVSLNGRTYRLCGAEPADIPALPQTSCEVRPLTTVCTFANAEADVEVRFMTPALPDDLDVFSRPVTYLAVRARDRNGAPLDARVVCGVTPAWATNDDAARMVTNRTTVAGHPALSIGRADQRPLGKAGDAVRCDWGYVWLVGPVVRDGETHFLLAYDDVKSVQWFDRALDAWWRRGGKTFPAMLAEAERDYPALTAKADAADAALAKDFRRVGGEKYARLASLVWRQSFAACKLVAGPDAQPLYLSKENGSGGFIGTVDVFYPQMPHLLLTSLPLVKGTLEPVLLYASTTNWPHAYAPHDLGLYPRATGQEYRMAAKFDDTHRMPVEECGNMLLCLGALATAEGNADFASRWWPVVTQWAEFLRKIGFDPDNQLCTDDFAGHLAHNANLSVKTILALAAYARLAELRGEKAVAADYLNVARGLARKWLAAAEGGKAGGSRLAFDQPGSWSMKYNLIWDRLLGFGLFPPGVARKELAAYRTVLEPYGLPLDSRKNWTKGDWTVWCAALTGDRDDFEALTGPLYRFAEETPDRIPFTDWYWADSGRFKGFIARSVAGAFFLPALFDRAAVEKWRTPRPERGKE